MIQGYSLQCGGEGMSKEASFAPRGVTFGSLFSSSWHLFHPSAVASDTSDRVSGLSCQVPRHTSLKETETLPVDLYHYAIGRSTGGNLSIWSTAGERVKNGETPAKNGGHANVFASAIWQRSYTRYFGLIFVQWEEVEMSIFRYFMSKWLRDSTAVLAVRLRLRAKC